jgi:hypothetical protein
MIPAALTSGITIDIAIVLTPLRLLTVPGSSVHTLIVKWGTSCGLMRHSMEGSHIIARRNIEVSRGEGFFYYTDAQGQDMVLWIDHETMRFRWPTK